MELICDWKGFQSIFYPRRRNQSPGRSALSPAYVLADDDCVVAAFAENEDLSDWTGASLKEVTSERNHRPLVTLQRKDVESWSSELLASPHFYEQVEFLRAKFMASAPEMEAPFSRHFLLEGLHSWWGKILPSSYGLFFRIEAQSTQDFLVIVQRGIVSGFHEPDLSTLGFERQRSHLEIVKYLSEKYLVPVQGVFLPSSEWADWIESEHPWREVAQSVRANRVKLVPFRWSLMTLVASRAFLGI